MAREFSKKEIASFEKMYTEIQERAAQIASEVFGWCYDTCFPIGVKIQGSLCKLAVWVEMPEREGKVTVAFPVEYLTMEIEDVRKAEEQRTKEINEAFDIMEKKQREKEAKVRLLEI